MRYGLLLYAVLGASAAQAQQRAARTPKFADHPVAEFRGSKPPLQLDREERGYRTRYRALYDSPPNFAGHYSVTEVGCGMGCTFLLAVDLKTGKPVSFKVPGGEELTHCPDQYRDAKGEPIFHQIDVRPTSRLMVVSGRMPGNECGARYFVETNGRMMQIRDIHLQARP